MSATPRLDILLDQMKRMSAGDVSVLAASFCVEDHEMMTAPGSPNDVLWTAMEREGWLSSAKKEISTKGVTLEMKVFRLKEAGHAPIRKLLDYFKPVTSSMNSRDVMQHLAPQLDAISDEVTPRLIDTVRQGGGNGSHIVFALSNIVARVTRRTFRPEDQEKVLQELFRQTNYLLNQMSP